MGIVKREIHNQEAVDATLHLETYCVPNFAKELEVWFKTAPDQKNIDLKTRMHEHGINCRYLFLVLRYVEDFKLKRILAIEVHVNKIHFLTYSYLDHGKSCKKINVGRNAKIEYQESYR